ncbi:aminoacyl-tRNA hydrolase [Candidatus Wolfebacteria bacterium]|nr:aminoacyl-tRNA hydrolase [Candidatus Wolfebacteria bacterium]
MEINPNLKFVKLIIGLGNPGKEYEKTRHNSGFLFIDYLNSQLSKKSPVKIPTEAKTLKSDVFMNASGNFAAKTLKKTGLKPENILIAHDDSDIELGKCKISFGRGAAGHKGVESIIKSLKTKNFWRLRIGIRPPKSKQKAEEFVLKKFNKKELADLNKIFEEISE